MQKENGNSLLLEIPSEETTRSTSTGDTSASICFGITSDTGTLRVDQREGDASQASGAWERNKLAVGTLRKGSVDTSVLAICTRRRCRETPELSVQGLSILAVLESECGTPVDRTSVGEESQREGGNDGVREVHLCRKRKLRFEKGGSDK